MTPDLAAVKQKQQQAWASGDFHAVAARIVLVAEQLVDTADLRAGWRVLDVATGSGNAAIAAARLGCQAIGVDYVPSLLARGRERAAAEGLDVALLEGDAEALPFPDRSFDAVTSVFGSMFAPDHEKAASELRARHQAGRHDRARELDARPASSASCSARSRPTCHLPRASARRCCGAPGSISRASSAARSRRSR